MFENLRYKIALILIKKSAKLIESGDFKDLRKGLRYFKYSIMIVPPSEELSEFGKQLREEANKHESKYCKEIES